MRQHEREKILLLQHMNEINPNDQINMYPPTRFMGSKNKLLSSIWAATEDLHFNSVLDLFSGSGAVGYMYKCHGKAVACNDYMAMAATFSKAMIENNSVRLNEEAINKILSSGDNTDHFVADTFSGLYFSDEDNNLIDNIRHNISMLDDPYEKAIAMTALIRAIMKKRPRGIFTYTGNRYDDGRKDLRKSLEQLFREAAVAVNEAVFDNRKVNLSSWHDSLDLDLPHYDLIYMDPPYYTPKSDNEYVRRYHFVEGLARNWDGVEIQENTKTKKFKSYPTPFSTLSGAEEAFDHLFEKYKSSILVISYSCNSQPDKEQMLRILSKYKNNVRVTPVEHTYSFGTTKNVKRNNVQEYIFVGY